MDKGQPLPFDAAAASTYMKKAGEVHGTVRVEVRARYGYPRIVGGYPHTYRRISAGTLIASAVWGELNDPRLTLQRAGRRESARALW